jgi:hypothetical protein
MGNKSIYFNDDEEEWIEEHINNLSEFVRGIMKEEREKKEKEILKEERVRQRSLLFYFSAFLIGMIVLMFVIIINLSEFKTSISLSIESLFLIIVGLGLEVVAINKIYRMKNGGKEKC